MENIKLVIWDLDDTFWKGTLSEGNVFSIQEKTNILKTLVDRGIMNSIVSKNDFDQAKKQLESFGVWNYFIFPKISWEPKGQIVKQLIDQCQLRATNTIFVDDNPSNRQEVKYYNPEINVIDAKDFTWEYIQSDPFRGKDDKNHSRLKQYKILEQRKSEEVKYSSNIDFLKDSNITISLGDDCVQNKARLLELIQRTNQLNFTKIRLSEAEFDQLLNQHYTKCRYIKAKDKFGDYGIVGFYALSNQHLLHFLFSCRVLGLGIENYVYNKLDCPDIDIVGEVAAELKKTSINWINEGSVETKANNKNDKTILMIGGCDLQQTDFYLSSQYKITREFATVVNGVEIRTSDSSQLINSLTLPESEKQLLCDKLPFYNKDITFASQIFSGKHDVIIYSIVDDPIRVLYHHRSKDYYITQFGYFNLENDRNTFKKEELTWLDENFTCQGPETNKYFENNLRFILDHIFDNNNQTEVLLINNNEIDVSDWVGKERYQRNIDMNKIVDIVAGDYPHVHIVDMRKIVHDRNDFSKEDNRHYTREVYYRMANEIMLILKNVAGLGEIRTHSDLAFSLKKLQKKFFDRICTTFHPRG